MSHRLVSPNRLAWILGPIALGIAATAMGQEVPTQPSPPDIDLRQFDDIRDDPAFDAQVNAKSKALNILDVDRDQVTRDVQAATQMAADDAATHAEIAATRFVLARHGYASAMQALLSPPNPDEMAGPNLYVDRFQTLHDWAGSADRAIRDMDRPTAAQVQFLREHVDRMRHASAEVVELSEGGGSGVGPTEAIAVQLMALEARTWFLKAERGAGEQSDDAGQEPGDGPEGP